VQAGAGRIHGHGLPGVQRGSEGIVEWRDPTDGPKPVEHVGQPLGRQGRWAVHHLKVQVRPGRAAAVSQQADHLALANPITLLHTLGADLSRHRFALAQLSMGAPIERRLLRPSTAAIGYLAAGLVYEMLISFVPVFLGSGARRFANLGEAPPKLKQGDAAVARRHPARRRCSHRRGMSNRSKFQRAVSAQPAGRPAGTLLAVSVGLPKDVPWQGKNVFTGVFKDPVTGPRRVRKLNVDGDGQGDLAGHGGEQRAVFVYQIDSYRFWERELGRHDFVYGQFGENFTVEGLSDDEVCIGDRYQIGTAVFEVTQPRVTCYRVGIRMNDPRIPALLVSHRRPGFYFRVLEEGEVQTGDEIIKVASGPEQMTVAEVSALLYLPGHPRQQLLRALRIGALSAGWQTSLRALLDGEPGSGNAGLITASPPPAWSGFLRLSVTAIDRESDSVISIRLEDPDGAPLPAARPGQYLTLRIQPDNGQRSVLRNYSLSGPPDAGYYRITVKREHDGAASGYLHTRLAVGEQLGIAAPRGTFILDRTHAPVLLISAGIGATPVLAMLQALAEEHSDREIWWLHGARSSRDHSFAAETRTLLASLPNVHTHVYYSRPGPNDLEGRDFDSAGRLTASLLAELEPPRDAEAYLCGPTPFMEEISAGLAAMGIDASRIHTEPFGPAPGLTPGIAATPVRRPHPPAGQPGNGPIIEFARSNVAIPWSGDYTSLLELAEACDVPVRWSCRTGVCHNCETTLIAGNVEYSPDPVEPPAVGSALICCSQPRDDVVLDL
jgi:ferredoxin-NADP reductase/MOSC domain-containing protein YiiM